MTVRPVGGGSSPPSAPAGALPTTAGLGNIAFSDVLARVVPRPLRGRARSWRGICGAVTGAAAGILIQRSLSAASGLRVFAALFMTAGILYGLGGLVFGAIAEPRTAKAQTRPTWGALLRSIRDVATSRGFGRFVLVEALLVPLTQALPFFILFGRRA
jgi:hypothetical protein